MIQAIAGFCGAWGDSANGHYPLGHGYRIYSPHLGRFTAPDSWSPFDAGGINTYVYCAGDPVNRADPSGHMSVGQWIGMGLGIVAGCALSMITDGAAIPAITSLIATTVGDAGIGAVSELLTEAVDGQPVAWGQVGIAAGISAAATVGGYGFGRLGRLKSPGQRPFRGLMMSAEGGPERALTARSPASGGQFRHPVFLGIFRPEGTEHTHIALSFVDTFQGAERLNIVAQSSRRPGGRFISLGAGAWTGTNYRPILVGSTRLSDFIQEELRYTPTIRSVKLAIPHASKLLRSEVNRFLRRKGVQIDLAIPETGFRIHGKVPDMIETLLAEAHGGTMGATGAHEVPPEVFQTAFTELTREFFDTQGAFSIDFE